MKNNVIRIIYPRNGYVLTLNRNIDILDRVFVEGDLYLAVNDSEENWMEISKVEAETLKKLKKEMLNNLRDLYN